MLQPLRPAIYPTSKPSFGLSFAQIGLLTLTNQITASLLQPVIGSSTDRRPQPYSLRARAGFARATVVRSALAVLPRLAAGRSAHPLLAPPPFAGLGSAVFHPESSRIARLASGGRH